MNKTLSTINEKYVGFKNKFITKNILIVGIALAAVFVLAWLWDGIEFLFGIPYLFDSFRYSIEAFDYGFFEGIKSLLNTCTDILSSAGYSLFLLALAVSFVIAALKKTKLSNIVLFVALVIGLLYYFNASADYLIYIIGDLKFLFNNFWFLIEDLLGVSGCLLMLLAMILAVGIFVLRKFNLPAIGIIAGMLGSLAVAGSCLCNLSNDLIIAIHPNWSFSHPFINAIGNIVMIIIYIALIVVFLISPIEKERDLQ